MSDNIVKRRPRKERPLFCTGAAVPGIAAVGPLKSTHEVDFSLPEVPVEEVAPSPMKVDLSPPPLPVPSDQPREEENQQDQPPSTGLSETKPCDNMFAELLHLTQTVQVDDVQGTQTVLGPLVAGKLLTAYGTNQWWCRVTVLGTLQNLESSRVQESEQLLAELVNKALQLREQVVGKEEEDLTQKAEVLEKQAIEAAEAENWELSAELSDSLQNLLFQIRSNQRTAVTERILQAGSVLKRLFEAPRLLTRRCFEEWLVIMGVASSTSCLCTEEQNLESVKNALFGQSNTALERLADASKVFEECRHALKDLDETQLPSLEQRERLTAEQSEEMKQHQADMKLLLDEEKELEQKLRAVREKRQSLEKLVWEKSLKINSETRELEALSLKFKDLRKTLISRQQTSEADCLKFEGELEKIQSALSEINDTTQRTQFVQQSGEFVAYVMDKRLPVFRELEDKVNRVVQDLTEEFAEALLSWQQDTLDISLVQLFETASQIRDDPQMQSITNEIRAALRSIENYTDGLPPEDHVYSSIVDRHVNALSHIQRAITFADTLKTSLQKASSTEDELSNVRNDADRIRTVDIAAATAAKNEALETRNFRAAAQKAQAIRVMEERLKELKTREKELAEKQARDEQKSSLLSQLLDNNSANQFCELLHAATRKFHEVLGKILEELPLADESICEAAVPDSKKAEEDEEGHQDPPVSNVWHECSRWASRYEKWMRDVVECSENLEVGVSRMIVPTPHDTPSSPRSGQE